MQYTMKYVTLNNTRHNAAFRTQAHNASSQRAAASNKATKRQNDIEEATPHEAKTTLAKRYGRSGTDCDNKKRRSDHEGKASKRQRQSNANKNATATTLTKNNLSERVGCWQRAAAMKGRMKRPVRCQMRAMLKIKKQLPLLCQHTLTIKKKDQTFEKLLTGEAAAAAKLRY